MFFPMKVIFYTKGWPNILFLYHFSPPQLESCRHYFSSSGQGSSIRKPHVLLKPSFSVIASAGFPFSTCCNFCHVIRMESFKELQIALQAHLNYTFCLRWYSDVGETSFEREFLSCDESRRFLPCLCEQVIFFLLLLKVRVFGSILIARASLEYMREIGHIFFTD